MKRDQEVTDGFGTRGKNWRKIAGGGEWKLSTALIQPKRRRKTPPVTPRNAFSPSSSKSDHVHDMPCVCGYDRSELTQESVNLSDLDEEKEEGVTTSKRKFDETGKSVETPPLREYEAEQGELESTATLPEDEATSLDKNLTKSTPEKIPSGEELEAFFSVAERKIQKQFAEKYNFDIVEDKPLEGRYEWDPLQP
ncbi:unnamed protein product [Cuscuta epithymum]|uniref:Cyclin-dependent kinase inhibitor domain-containing protein n=1 Tax=Cuscuta epithymum TaxID=186058 RepID=A0AAV0BZ28_9ASTE|nr:unnamed protein product [Cuscuta epithymum]